MCAGVLDTEVVIYFPLVDGSRSLRDQLSTEHAIVVPDARVIDCDLDTLLASRIRRVLVIGGEIDVFRHWAITVDVVLIWAYFIGERPFFQE